MPTSNEVIALIVLVAINIIVMVFTAFFKAYGAKKGENLATKEDLKDVLVQVKEVTATIEEIKRDISERTWSKQRHWDLKRDSHAGIRDPLRGIG
jgi:Flp pilus assembly protein CpaB